jgi:hypothetical protein
MLQAGGVSAAGNSARGSASEVLGDREQSVAAGDHRQRDEAGQQGPLQAGLRTADRGGGGGELRGPEEQPLASERFLPKGSGGTGESTWEELVEQSRRDSEARSKSVAAHGLWPDVAEVYRHPAPPCEIHLVYMRRILQEGARVYTGKRFCRDAGFDAQPLPDQPGCTVSPYKHRICTGHLKAYSTGFDAQPLPDQPGATNAPGSEAGRRDGGGGG